MMILRIVVTGHAICHVQIGHLFIELKAGPVVTHIARQVLLYIVNTNVSLFVQ